MGFNHLYCQQYVSGASEVTRARSWVVGWNMGELCCLDEWYDSISRWTTYAFCFHDQSSVII